MQLVYFEVTVGRHSKSSSHSMRAHWHPPIWSTSVRCLQRKRCDQMARLFVIFWPLMTKKYSSITSKLPQKFRNFVQYKINPCTNANDFKNVAKVAKFRPIWSYWKKVVVYFTDTVAYKQCDQIGRFSKVLGSKFSHQRGPNIWKLFGLFWSTLSLYNKK